MANNQFDSSSKFNQQNLPPEMSAQYKEDIKNMFDAFQNEDGKINIQEFKELLKESEMSQHCSILIQKLDRERKSELNRNEFDKLFSTNMNEGENFKMVFDLIDSSKSGSLSISELDLSLKKYGLSLSQEELSMMFKYIGNSRVDSVTFEELKNALFNIE